MKRIMVLMALAAASLLAGACSGDADSAADGELSDAAVEADAADREAVSKAADDPGFDRPSEFEEPPAPVVPVPGRAGMTLSGGLQPVGASGVRGNLTVAALEDGSTFVTVQVTEAPRGTPLVAELRSGGCGADARVVRRVGALVVNAEGFAVLSDTLDVRATEVMDGRHALAVAPDGGDAAPVACAPLPRNEPADL